LFSICAIFFSYFSFILLSSSNTYCFHLFYSTLSFILALIIFNYSTKDILQWYICIFTHCPLCFYCHTVLCIVYTLTQIYNYCFIQLPLNQIEKELKTIHIQGFFLFTYVFTFTSVLYVFMWIQVTIQCPFLSV